MNIIHSILFTSTCPLWLFLLSFTVAFIMFVFIYLKQHNIWKAKLSKQQKQSEAQIQEIQHQSSAEISRIKTESATRIECIQAEAAESLAYERANSAKALQQERETIKQDRQHLLEMCEKELLVSMMQTLGAYASRLDRLEHSMSEFNTTAHLQQEGTIQLSNQMQMLFSQHSSPLDKIQDHINALSNQVDELRGYDKFVTLTDISESIDSTKRDISDAIDTIKRATDEIEWRIQQLS